MTRFLSLLILVVGTQIVQAQTPEETIVRQILDRQTKSWNKGDLEGFMQGYIKSDSLKFYGSRGITNGWQNTLDNYKKGYPTKAETGNLSFTIDAITKIEEGAYYMMGQFHLVRDVGNANGVFLIIFRKIEGEWKVIADLSC